MIPIGEINAEKNIKFMLSVEGEQTEDTIGYFIASARELIECQQGQTETSTRSYNFFNDDDDKMKMAKISFGIKFKMNDGSDVKNHIAQLDKHNK